MSKMLQLRTAKLAVIASLVFGTQGQMMLAAGGTWRAHRPGAARVNAQPVTVYTCPMHRDYHSDHPGDCPICGMRIEPERGAAPPPRARSRTARRR